MLKLKQLIGPRTSKLSVREFARAGVCKSTPARDSVGYLLAIVLATSRRAPDFRQHSADLHSHFRMGSRHVRRRLFREVYASERARAARIIG
jgi:hypothetical protein